MVAETGVGAQHLHDAERFGVGADDDDPALQLAAGAGPAERVANDAPLDDERGHRGRERQ